MILATDLQVRPLIPGKIKYFGACFHYIQNANLNNPCSPIFVGELRPKADPSLSFCAFCLKAPSVYD
jgi:hypothetical protein